MAQYFTLEHVYFAAMM